MGISSKVKANNINIIVRIFYRILTEQGNGNAEQHTVVRVTTLDNLTTRREELLQLAGGNSGIAFAESLLLQAANHRRSEQS